ncbi:hypothetical protein [Actinoplanes sp. NBRC 103695]|uniref:hypothetical protein n=1 Tax=Actinoplanes sp. NBRC 103695 TaxID=3032202 RepID=UPI0024A00C6D|nr:hypothetical protein [Actinoplanes sp. NBRC 103695]GLY96626.1 hypothetical protein Acsp02_38810 [Actinoplanes sp. NBRC 103695]
MTDKHLAAAFYLRSGRPLEELLAAAGATDIDPPMCRWAGMTCRAYLHETMLVLTFFRDFDENALVEAFERACEALEPDAALVVTHPDEADVDALRRIAGQVAEADATALAARRFGLLYVSDKLADYQTGGWIGAGREVIPTVGGQLIFGGEGAHRLS